MELWFLVLTLFTTSAAIGPLDHNSCDALREQFAQMGNVMDLPMHPLCAQAMASADAVQLREERMPREHRYIVPPAAKPKHHGWLPHWRRIMPSHELYPGK